MSISNDDIRRYFQGELETLVSLSRKQVLDEILETLDLLIKEKDAKLMDLECPSGELLELTIQVALLRDMRAWLRTTRDLEES